MKYVQVTYNSSTRLVPLADIRGYFYIGDCAYLQISQRITPVDGACLNQLINQAEQTGMTLRALPVRK